MRDIFTLFLHVIVIIIRLARPGGLRSVVAESVLMRHQVLILNRGRKRAPNLRVSDRVIGGLCTLLMRPARVLRSAIALSPSIGPIVDFSSACRWTSQQNFVMRFRRAYPQSGNVGSHNPGGE